VKKIITFVIAAILMAVWCVLPASASDYTFNARDRNDFYQSTLYGDVYGSRYNYGGSNVTDFYDPLALPGLVSPSPQISGYLSADTSRPYGIYDANAPIGASSGFFTYITPWETAFTATSGLTRSDGSIGTLIIPSLSINMKAFEGTTSASMAKGVGHFPETSGWSGNVGLCGHNRNATYTIGAIKDLRIGDTIQYSTVMGTRTYAVSFVGTISGTDWSYLAATPDNRITLITCLAGQPALRVCVQAVEIR